MGICALHHACGIGLTVIDLFPLSSYDHDNKSFILLFVNCNILLINAGNVELMKLLVFKDSDMDLPSDAGTPLIWAAGHGKEAAVKFLLERNANVCSQFFNNADFFPYIRASR